MDSDLRSEDGHVAAAVARAPRPRFRPDLFAPRGAGDGPGIPPRAVALEWAVLAAVVLAFCAVFLSFDGTRTLPGNEAEVFQSLDWTLVNSLERFGEFPLWNPYLRGGFTYVADPFLHVYNPLATLPVLIFGVKAGFQIALLLSFLAAALGMWYLGVALKFDRPARLWAGLMYAFTGQGVARFFQGEYDFVLGFAWIPWTLAFLLLAAGTRQRRYVAGAAASLALLFFSGNVYYTFYMVFVVALFALVSAVSFDRRARRPRWRWRPLLIVAVIALLAAGLAAVQWLPLADYWKSYNKIPDTALVGSHSPGQIWLDYTSKDHQRPDAYGTLPSEEFYAYTGVWPFLALAFAPLAVRRGNRRTLLFLALLFLLAVAYVATKYMPWAGLYRGSELLSQFRYQTRMLIYGAVAAIALAGCGLDAAWRRIGPGAKLAHVSVPGLARWAGGRLGAIALIAFMVWSAADVYGANRVHARAWPAYAPPYELVGWLSRHDGSAFYFGTPNGWHGATFSNSIRYLDAWYGLEPILPVQGASNARPVRARPNYVALGNDRTPEAAAELVRQFSEHSLWRLPQSLPYVFAVADLVLADPAGGAELTSADVRPLAPVSASPNRIVVDADGRGGETLVALTAAYRGWRLTVDGRPAPLRNVGGYLAAALQPGTHRYTFSFSPWSFWAGLVLSLATLAGVTVLLALERRSKPRRLRTDAVYAAGVLRPESPLALEEDARVRITVEPYRPPPAPDAGEGSGAAGAARLGWILFGLGMAVYLVTRLWQIDRFPINFFADEATFTLFAQDLWARGLRDGHGTFLPVYFEVAGNRWTPVLAVYTHLPEVALFGKSIIGTRATSALVTLLVPLAVALALKLIFRARYWWAAALLVAVVPTWFLHSRTAFEWLTMASCYACFILSYLLYRVRSPKFLFLAIVFGAATFYNHASGQLVMAASALLLGISDIRYHLKHWRFLLPGLLLVVFLAIPLIRLQFDQPGAMMKHLHTINSYWFQDIPFIDKLRQFGETYLYGLSPGYWFFPNEHDLIRHRMKGYGNLGLGMLPLVLAGTLVSLRRFRSAPHRAVLLAAIAAPAGAATAEVALTRMMAFIPPAVILAGLGLDLLLAWLARGILALRSGPRVASNIARALPFAVFVTLSAASVGMMRDAVVNGPTWYDDYGLYGMQYGARELFAEAIPRYLEADPTATVLVSSSWANGADTFIRFFLPREQQFTRVQMRDIHYFMSKRRELTPAMVFVMPADEYEQARNSPKFGRVDVEQIVPYPDGRPGFYFARLAYADDFDAILARENEARSRPVTAQFALDGQAVTITHSPFDIGQLSDLFDGDTFSLARGLEANPLVLDFAFSAPRRIQGLTATFGSMDFKLTARLYAEGASEPQVYEQVFTGLPLDPTVAMAFDRGPEPVSRLRLEVFQLNAGEEVHIHVREITFK